jgi:hypothetical protein
MKTPSLFYVTIVIERDDTTLISGLWDCRDDRADHPGPGDQIGIQDRPIGAETAVEPIWPRLWTYIEDVSMMEHRFKLNSLSIARICLCYS